MALTVSAHPGLEALQDGFYMLDPEWRVTYWNAAAERLLGIPRDDALGSVIWEVVPQLRETGAAEHLRAAMRDSSSGSFLEPYTSGRCRRTYRVQVSPIEGEGVAVQFRDATEEVRLEKQHSHLLESIQDGFVAVDEEGRIVYMNRVAERLLRLPRQHGLGNRVWPLLPKQPESVAENLRLTMEDGRPRKLRAIRPEGRVFHGRSFDLWLHPLPDGGVSALFQDVTERVRREKELARYAAEAEEANRAKSRFFAAVSHELRTPLNAIVGYTHLLSTGTYGTMPSGALRAADRASICAEHLARMVDDVLLMTTAEIGRLPVAPSPVLLADFLPRLIEPIRHQAEAKGLQLTLMVADGIAPVITDPERLRQVVVALASNAVKFTRRGEVRVEAGIGNGGQPAPGSSNGVRLAGGEDEVWIRVVDTGPGIPREDWTRIFEAFEQLGDPSRSDSLNRGTGLGLAIARQLAQLLRGRLELEPMPSGGASFCLLLPRVFPGSAT